MKFGIRPARRGAEPSWASVVADNLAEVAAANCPPRSEVDVVAHEPNRAVAQQEIHATAVGTARQSRDAHLAIGRLDTLMASGPRGYGATFGNLWVSSLYSREAVAAW